MKSLSLVGGTVCAIAVCLCLPVRSHAQTVTTTIERDAVSTLPTLQPTGGRIASSKVLNKMEISVGGTPPNEAAERAWRTSHSRTEGWRYYKGAFEAAEPYGYMTVKRPHGIDMAWGTSEIPSGVTSVRGMKTVYGPPPPGDDGLHSSVQKKVWEWSVPAPWKEYYADAAPGIRFSGVYLTPSRAGASAGYPPPVLLCFENARGLAWQAEIPLQAALGALPTPSADANQVYSDDWQNIGHWSRYRSGIFLDGTSGYAMFFFPKRGVSLLFIVGSDGKTRRIFRFKGWETREEVGVGTFDKLAIHLAPLQNEEMYPEFKPDTDAPKSDEILLLDVKTLALRRVVDGDNKPVRNFHTNFNDTFAWVTLTAQGVIFGKNGEHRDDAYWTYDMRPPTP